MTNKPKAVCVLSFIAILLILVIICACILHFIPASREYKWWIIGIAAFIVLTAGVGLYAKYKMTIPKINPETEIIGKGLSDDGCPAAKVDMSEIKCSGDQAEKHIRLKLHPDKNHSCQDQAKELFTLADNICEERYRKTPPPTDDTEQWQPTDDTEQTAYNQWYKTKPNFNEETKPDYSKPRYTERPTDDKKK